MKKNLLLILLLHALFTTGQTSVYYQFPDSNAVWNIHFQLYCFANGTADEYYSITISGDTVINSQTYHKLSTPYVRSFSTGICGGLAAGYKGAIRQDTANKKVFFVPPVSNAEQLLYDFTLKVGDTVKGYTETNAAPTDVVKSIDSVLVGNTYRKRWNINTCYNIHIIEGIGSTYGLIERSPGCATDQADYSLICFQQNKAALYPIPSPSCELITAVNSTNETSVLINIFPNPSNGSFIVDMNQSIKEIRLADLLGHVVLQRRTNNLTQLSVDNLQSGTYILTLLDKDNKMINRKIIACP